MNGAPDDLDNMAAAQLDFERHFGRSEETSVQIGELAGERVIIVDSHSKRAFYSMNVEILKVINLTGND